MKKLFKFALAFLLIFNQFPSKIFALDSEASLDKSQIIIANKYAERFCSAKADNFFEGLDNEKTLKYSYFKYIGLQNEEIFSNDLYKTLIHQIKEKCDIKEEEEEEIKEFYLVNKK
tara:strand:+ start:450 stop:797 length:348 start_codon:yes stop_codon:yes gene_type:complete